MIAAALLTLALVVPPPGTCMPASTLAAGAVADGGAVRVWKGDAAARAFAFMSTKGYLSAGDAVMAVPTSIGVMLGIISGEDICEIIVIPNSGWRALQVAVEGLPV